jgi:hypothetical protein
MLTISVYMDVSVGKTLAQPQDCPAEVYKLMSQCWTTDPEKRPTFVELFDNFRNIQISISGKTSNKANSNTKWADHASFYAETFPTGSVKLTPNN